MDKSTTKNKQDDLSPFHTRLYTSQRHKLKMLMVKWGLSTEAEVVRKLIEEAGS